MPARSSGKYRPTAPAAGCGLDLCHKYIYLLYVFVYIVPRTGLVQKCKSTELYKSPPNGQPKCTGRVAMIKIVYHFGQCTCAWGRSCVGAAAVSARRMWMRWDVAAWLEQNSKSNVPCVCTNGVGMNPSTFPRAARGLHWLIWSVRLLPRGTKYR